jgi:hypothetical protein
VPVARRAAVVAILLGVATAAATGAACFFSVAVLVPDLPDSGLCVGVDAESPTQVLAPTALCGAIPIVPVADRVFYCAPGSSGPASSYDYACSEGDGGACSWERVAVAEEAGLPQTMLFPAGFAASSDGTRLFIAFQGGPIMNGGGYYVTSASVADASLDPLVSLPGLMGPIAGAWGGLAVVANAGMTPLGQVQVILLSDPSSSDAATTLATVDAGTVSSLGFSDAGVFWRAGLTVGAVPSPGASPRVFSANDPNASGVAGDGTYVYWADSLADAGSVLMRASAAGDAAPSIFAALDDGTNAAVLLAADDRNLYWVHTQAHTLYALPFAGGCTRVVSTSVLGPTALAVGDSAVYVVVSAQSGQSSILRLPKP